jgi:flagellar motor protein MotB
MARPLKLPIGLTSVEKDETEVRWLISYSDFMMQLVCLFILLYAASLLGKDRLAIVARSYRQAVGLGEPPLRPAAPAAGGAEEEDPPLAGGDLGPADVPPGVAYRVEPVRGGRQVSFTPPLFEPGSGVLTPEARAILDEVAGRLRPYAGTVVVTGTAGADDPGADSMRLAQARAEAAVRHLCREGFEAALDPRFVEASGRLGGGPDARRVRIVVRER